jgi:catechol 2,3-dioxygenase-like lactoylglutathione lyase family enzyme
MRILPPALARAIVLGLLGLPGYARSPSDIRFHHVHMNVVDPARSAAFYTTAFEQTRKTHVAGWQGVETEDSFILFNRVSKPASTEWDTPIWHFGWNSPDTLGAYKRLASQGVVFFRVPPPSAHLVGPDGNDVEIAPAGSQTGGRGPTAFNHVHLMSDAPLCAADWYENVLGIRPNRTRAPRPPDCHVPFAPRHDPANQIHEPNARMFVGDILIFIYPNQRLAAMTPRAVETMTPLVSPRGRVLDHIAFSHPDVPALVVRLRASGVKILEDVHHFGSTNLKAAMIEGPDSIVIELIERR